jgi:hypothetical protein
LKLHHYKKFIAGEAAPPPPQTFEQWLSVTTFPPGYAPINGLTTVLMEMAFAGGVDCLRMRLQDMRRMGEQKDDPAMVNQAQTLLNILNGVCQ